MDLIERRRKLLDKIHEIKGEQKYDVFRGQLGEIPKLEKAIAKIERKMARERSDQRRGDPNEPDVDYS